jgi:hypothetical protein
MPFKRLWIITSAMKNILRPAVSTFPAMAKSQVDSMYVRFLCDNVIRCVAKSLQAGCDEAWQLCSFFFLPGSYFLCSSGQGVLSSLIIIPPHIFQPSTWSSLQRSFWLSFHFSSESMPKHQALVPPLDTGIAAKLPADGQESSL